MDDKKTKYRREYYLKNKEKLKVKGFLKIKGPIIVTAGMFQLPKNNFKFWRARLEAQ
jgi:hypothetical protein